MRLFDTLDSPHSDSLVIHDFPLDYEILQDGDYYVKPESETDLYYPAYTVIPTDYQLPGGLPYEVLADVYKPTEQEFNVETVALIFAGFQEDIIADYGQEISVEELPTFLDTLTIEQGRGILGLFGRRYRPIGSVHIENTETNNTHEPLARARISTGRFIWWRYTYTDNSGHFRATKRYRGKVRVRAKWRSYEATIRKTFTEMLGFWVSDHLMTLTRRSNNKVMHIRRWNEHLWYKGTVHNGIIEYNNFLALRGMNRSVLFANVWVWENGNGNASTPMLYRYRQLPILANLAGKSQFTVWNSVTSAVIGLLPSRLRPDMLFTGLENQRDNSGIPNSGRIQQKVFHESSHFIHAVKAGSWFWANVFAAEVGNQINHGDPYHNGTKPTLSAGRRIALAEGWATFLEYRTMRSVYGKAYISSYGYFTDPTSYIDNFNMYTVPMYQPDDDNNHWFLTGLFWDLRDSGSENGKLRNGQSGVPINAIEDNIYFTDLNFLFNFMKYDVHSGYDLKSELINHFGQNSLAIPGINNTFSSYGY